MWGRVRIQSSPSTRAARQCLSSSSLYTSGLGWRRTRPSPFWATSAVTTKLHRSTKRSRGRPKVQKLSTRTIQTKQTKRSNERRKKNPQQESRHAVQVSKATQHLLADQFVWKGMRISLLTASRLIRRSMRLKKGGILE